MDCIKLWKCLPTYNQATADMQQILHPVATLRSGKQGYGPPLTSFDWNNVDPRILLTSSIDTTCSVWDVQTQKMRTQLIAHDREVFDAEFFTGSQDCFASVGGDGSVRSFDLRSLDHCSILYEARAAIAATDNSSSPSPANSKAMMRSFAPPLMRVACHPVDPNYIATFALDAHVASIIDVRVPSIPILQLTGHKAPIHDMVWSPTSRHQICTVGADAHVLVWDVQKPLLIRDQYQRQAAIAAMGSTIDSQSKNSSMAAGSGGGGGDSMERARSAIIALQHRTISVDPSLTYGARMPVSSVSWSWTSPEWIGITFGRTFQALRL